MPKLTELLWYMRLEQLDVFFVLDTRATVDRHAPSTLAPTNRCTTLLLLATPGCLPHLMELITVWAKPRRPRRLHHNPFTQPSYCLP